MTDSNRRARRRWKTGSALFLGLLMAVALGIVLSRLIISPEQAKIAEPPPEPVWAEVASRNLSTVEEFRGTVEAADAIELQYVTGEVLPVITGAPLSSGDAVKECQPLVEVSDRPAFALEGEVPPYRDLKEGDVGDDVSRLQVALRSCGYQVVVDGEFGAQTAAAVRRLYSESGYKPPVEEVAVGSGSPAADVEGDGPATASPSNAVEDPGEGASIREVVLLPASEVYFLGGDYRVVAVPPVGTAVGQEFVRLTRGSLKLRLEVSPALKQALTEGEPATVSIGPEQYPVVVPPLPVAPESNSSGEPTFIVEVDLPSDLDSSLVGSPGSFTTIAGEDSVYEKVAPVSAVRTDPSGRTYVVKDVADGEPVAVEVRILAASGGFVALEGEIGPGERLWLSDEPR